MKHPSTRELFDYWNARRGRRTAPERAEIEPSAIRRVLADTFILGFDPPTGHPFRIAGTRVCALFGRELKGEAFLRLWQQPSDERLRELTTIVTDESIGIVAGVSATDVSGDALDLELLMLPLSHQGRTDARVIGALAPVAAPYWVGVHALEHLVLDSFRYLGATDAPPTPVFIPPLRNGRIKHGLVVYEGGQARAVSRVPSGG